MDFKTFRESNTGHGIKVLADIACIGFFIYLLAYYPLSPSFNFFPQFNDFVQCKTNMENIRVIQSCAHGWMCAPAPLNASNFTFINVSEAIP